MQIEREPSVAIYWDFENIHASVMTVAKGANWFADLKSGRLETRDTAVVDVAAVMQYASTLGEVVINRAYANWSFLWAYTPQLNTYSMDLVQLFPIGKNAKNGADIRLSLDIAEDLVTHPHIDYVLLVSGDSDFIAIAQRVRRRHKRIIGLGVERSTNRYWQMACNEFKLYHTIVAQYGVDDAEPAGGTNGTSAKLGKASPAVAKTRPSTPARSTTTKSSTKSSATAGKSAADESSTAAAAKTGADQSAVAPTTKSDDPAGTANSGSASGSTSGSTSGGKTAKPKRGTRGKTGAATEAEPGAARDDDGQTDEPTYALARADGDDSGAGEATDEGAEGTPADADAREQAAAERKLLVQAIQSLEAREGKPWVMRVKIKPMMTRLDPAFDEANLGYGNFTEFLEGNEDLVDLRPTEGDLLVRVKVAKRTNRRGGRGVRVRRGA